MPIAAPREAPRETSKTSEQQKRRPRLTSYAGVHRPTVADPSGETTRAGPNLTHISGGRARYRNNRRILRDRAERDEHAITALDLNGEIQIASFHPDYRFAGSSDDAIENYTNRSPFPMLHLLREASVERAVAAFPDADAIIERNMATLNQLGVEGWQRLMAIRQDP